MDELQQKTGQLFITGFPGAKPSSEFLRLAEQVQFGGFILFEENCPTPDQTRANIKALSLCCATPPIIAVDQEGGRVCRVRGKPAEYESAASYGSDDSTDRFEQDYTEAAAVLCELGFNTNLAPVADILLNEKNECLQGRCFGRTAEAVIPFIEAGVRISHAAGLLSCLKHFPGLGAAAADPHVAVTTADYDESVWRDREQLPFVRGVQTGADMVMTTHLLLPAVDERIATGSKKIVTSWLRDDMKYDGVVITDDLCMAGADALGDCGERSIAAFECGHDLLLFGREFEHAAEACHTFQAAVASGQVSAEHVRQSHNRIASMKHKLLEGKRG